MSAYSDKINNQFLANPTIALRQLLADDSSGNLEATYLLGKAYYDSLYLKPDSSLALQYWEKGAAHSDLDCQYALGDCHLVGFGYPEDNFKALAIYQSILQKAPDYHQALCQIGRTYGYGWGVAQDIPRAINTLTDAWNKGSARAATEIGLLYMFEMEKTDDNIKSAIKWYQRGADRSDSKGFHRMGLLYYYGDYGIPQSPQMAFRCFVQGKEQARALAMLITSNGCGVASEEEMRTIWAEAERRAEFGCSQLQEALGTAYAKGTGVPPSVELSEKWYRAASENGNSFAAYQLGIQYRFGLDGFPRDFEQAYHHLFLAANSGEGCAMKPLADLLNDEYISSLTAQEQNEQKIYWFDKSITEAEEWHSAVVLGQIYETGDSSGSVDVSKAIYYYQIAADHSIDMVYLPLAKLYLAPGPTANYRLAHHYLCLAKESAITDFQIAEIEYYYGRIYKNGLGVPQNLEDAQRHFALAAEKGYPKAVQELEHFKKGIFGWRLI